MSKNGDPVRIGILGAARVAEYAMIAPAHGEPSAQLLSIAARDPARARAYADKHDIARVHQSYTALMTDPEIELVYIATPPSLHAALALEALAAGKHVLVEKPFSMTRAEAAKVADVARTKGLFVAEAMHSRHHRLFGRLGDILRSGALGDVTSMSGLFNAPISRNADEFRWQRALGGGALMDLGVYPLAWLRGLTGEEPDVVRASAEMDGEVDGAIEATLHFPSRITGRIRAAMNVAQFAAQLVVEGTRGTLVVNNPLAPQLGHEIRFGREGAWTVETMAGPTSFGAQLSSVCAAVRGERPFPLGADDYVRSMGAIDAVRERSAAR